MAKKATANAYERSVTRGVRGFHDGGESQQTPSLIRTMAGQQQSAILCAHFPKRGAGRMVNLVHVSSAQSIIRGVFVPYVPAAVAYCRPSPSPCPRANGYVRSGRKWHAS